MEIKSHKPDFWDALHDLKRDCEQPAFSNSNDRELCWQIWELAVKKFGDPSLNPGGLQLDARLVPTFCRRKFAEPKETNDVLVLELTTAVQKLKD
jgi:hypothetical protein